MTLYIMRHGEAIMASPADAGRTLTEHGRQTVTAMAGLLERSAFGKPDLVLASPLRRAQDTAGIILDRFATGATHETSEALVPEGDVMAAMALIASQRARAETLMLVGHDPLLSILASAILTGRDEVVVEMKRSAVIVFELYRFDVPRLRGALRAFLPPQIVA